MLVNLWSFILPIILAIMAAYILSQFLFTDKETKKRILKAQLAVMSDRELERIKEDKPTQMIVALLPKIQNMINLDHIILNDIRSMLNLMGIKRRPEIVLASYIAYGMIVALPVFLLPPITGFWGYLALYPIAVIFLTYQKYRELQKKYKKWQLEMTKDLPPLIDKLRTSFASGRDYVSAFRQAADNSGPLMKTVLEKLLNDFNSMGHEQALNLFADSFKMPIVNKFCSAVKMYINYGAEAAENYFAVIETNIIELKKVALQELTRSKPEKVFQLYLIMFALAMASIGLTGWAIFSQLNNVL